jgi:hypothetical protein
MEEPLNGIDTKGKKYRVESIKENLMALERQLASAPPAMEISIKTSINNLRRELAELENEIN